MLKSFKTFILFEFKSYKNINNHFIDEITNEYIPYYYVPFLFPDNEDGYGGLRDNEDYFLSFPSNRFVYDYITDNEISEALKNEDLSNIDVTKGWENVEDVNDDPIYNTAYNNKKKHILRVAKLVQEIKEHKKLKPVSMFFDESAYIHDMPNYIEDGNHRIRALQYLKYETYPAYIYGHHSKYLIEYLKKIRSSK